MILLATLRRLLRRRIIVAAFQSCIPSCRQSVAVFFRSQWTRKAVDRVAGSMLDSIRDWEYKISRIR